eukprot:TRINITY_DN411_c0_g1_i1.p1 TRINITY_DN411_c0_g1~~TRINITY_DN411_c0_g1_i1.p1  ORF type:complete len:759 (-),score=138.54 TRINITY_DN411_c0_g1_i1:202-2478(-)
MASCPHIRNSSLLPSLGRNANVHKDECTMCFDSIYSPEGLSVCLTCWNGGCNSNSAHAALHFTKTNHPLVLNIHRTVIQTPELDPPQKITKVAIGVEGGLKLDEEKYVENFSVYCFACKVTHKLDETLQLQQSVDQVMKASSAAKKEELKAWENLRNPCEHTLTLQQVSGAVVPSTQKCHDCDVSTHLWLCLVCGNLACGRKNFDGSGGNGHALRHFETTGHSLVVKMGTVTPEGTADVHCYSCDEEVVDTELSKHLSNFGIDMGLQQKTEISLAEMELERNLNWNFKMTTEDGTAFEPIYGPGYTGMLNLGNSCYMASAVQMIMSIDEVRRRYVEQAQEHFNTCKGPHASCFHCQMHKLATGLWSGRHSFETSDRQLKKLVGVRPLMFKAVIGGDHPEFSSMRQQDASEYLYHLFSVIQRKERASGQGADVSSLFSFTSEERLQCLTCQQVGYSNVTQTDFPLYVPPEPKEHQLEQLFQIMYNSEYVQYTCPTCKRFTRSLRSLKFFTFPKYLMIVARRFVYQNYVVRKLDCAIRAPQTLDLGSFRSVGPQPDEKLFPPDDDDDELIPVPVNESLLAELLMMGFPEVRSRKALIATGDDSLEAAMNWLLEHMDDPDIDNPMPSAERSSSSTQAFPTEVIAMLTDMGFTQTKATKALQETDGNPERAVDWLFSHMDDPEPTESSAPSTSEPVQKDDGPAKYDLVGFVTHLGTSTSCGHYVVHLLKEGKWVVYNDEEVAVTPVVPSENAYVYLYKRQSE